MRSMILDLKVPASERATRENTRWNPKLKHPRPEEAIRHGRHGLSMSSRAFIAVCELAAHFLTEPLVFTTFDLDEFLDWALAS